MCELKVGEGTNEVPHSSFKPESRLCKSVVFVVCPFVFCPRAEDVLMFGAYSWVKFLCVLSLTKSCFLMRIPTVELLQSLPLAYYMAAEAALCVFRPDFSS